MFLKNAIGFVALVSVVTVVCPRTLVSQDYSEPDESNLAYELIDRLLERGSRTTMNELLEMPADIVVPTLVDAMNSDASLRDMGSHRQAAYELLYRVKATKYTAGFNQVVVGLQDSVRQIRKFCLSALGDAPQPYQAEASRLLVEYLKGAQQHQMVTHEYVSAFDALAKIGAGAEPVESEILQFTRSGYNDGIFSGEAAATYLRVAGTAECFENVSVQDSLTLYGILRELGRIGKRSKGTYETDSVGRRRIYDYVMNHLRSENSALVSPALGSGYTVLFFMHENLPEETLPYYTGFRDEVERIAGNTERPELAEEAGRVIEGLDKLSQRVERKR